MNFFIFHPIFGNQVFDFAFCLQSMDHIISDRCFGSFGATQTLLLLCYKQFFHFSFIQFLLIQILLLLFEFFGRSLFGKRICQGFSYLAIIKMVPVNSFIRRTYLVLILKFKMFFYLWNWGNFSHLRSYIFFGFPIPIFSMINLDILLKIMAILILDSNRLNFLLILFPHYLKMGSRILTFQDGCELFYPPFHCLNLKKDNLLGQWLIRGGFGNASIESIDAKKDKFFRGNIFVFWGDVLEKLSNQRFVKNCFLHNLIYNSYKQSKFPIN